MMAAPVIWRPSTDFSDFEETQPNTPKSGVQLDAQFDDISAAIINHRDVIKDIRRDDGALVNGIVTEDSLAPGLLDTLSSETGATEAAASAAAAAVSAASAAEDASELAIVADLIAANSYYLDDGSITDAATSAFDDGLIV
jgi:hypothetical protein